MSSQSRAVTRNPLLKLLVKRCPAGVKRLMLLSSFIAYVANTKDPERDFVRNMNQALTLSRGSDASLEFPIRLSRVFWGDRELFRDEIHTLTSNSSRFEKEAAALKIASLVPSWFAYGKPEVMAHDIALYFSSHHTALKTA